MTASSNHPKKYTTTQLDKWKREINAGPIIATRVNLRRENNEWCGLCCFHQEKTPSFKVYRDSDGVWLYKCFGCGKTGNVFQFVQEFDKVSFTRAVEIVLEQAGTIDPNEVEAKPKSKKLITIPISQYAQCEHALESSTAGQKWITDRGITMETARRFHLGFVQDGSAFCDPEHPWKTQGWIAVPTLSVPGHQVYAIKYRSIVGKKETIDGKLWSGILRAPHMPTTLFNLREVNAPITTPDGDTVIEKNDLHNTFITEGEYNTDVFVCEGEPDTLVLSQTGTPAVGLVSSVYRPNEMECDVLRRAQRRFLAGDNTPDGIKAMIRLWKELGPNTYFIQWPDGIKDANEMLLDNCLGSPALFKDMLDELKTEAVERGEWTEPKPEPKPEPKKESKKESAVPQPPAPCADQTGSTLKPKRVKWLWLDRIPLSKIALFAGNPDNGKSLVAMDVAARVTTGRPFPDGVNTFPASDVLMMLGEDDLEDTAVPRLMAAEANLDLIHFLEAITTVGDSGKSEIRLDENMPNLEASLKKYPNARLLVIDPISNYLGRASMIAEQEVRDRVLIPLKRLSAKYQIAIVLVMHLNKKSDLEAISRVGGAMAFVGVARASWLFIRDASSEEGEIKDSFSMARIKNNLTKASSGGNAYHIQSRMVMTDDDGEVFAPYVVWDGVVQKSADDVMASHHANKHEGPGRPAGGADTELARAKHFLAEKLASGPVDGQEIKADAKGLVDKISEATLRRAAKEMKIKAPRVGKKYMWTLPPMNATAATVAATKPQDEGAEAEAVPTAGEESSDTVIDRAFELK